MPPIKEKIAELFSGCHSGVLTRAHRGTELPKRCRRRKRQKGKPGPDFEEELLEAAMAWASEEEDEFLQAVPQGETMTERQAEVYFWRNAEMIEVLMRKEGLRARLD